MSSKNQDDTTDDTNSAAEKHATVADRFGRTTDPLAEFDDAFWQMERDDGVNPFDMWLAEEVDPKGYSAGYVDNLTRHVDQWRDFMQDNFDRHPACPSTEHAKAFAYDCLGGEDGNQPGVVGSKIDTLDRVLRYFQAEPSFPHPTDFNPFQSAKHKIDLSREDPKDPHPISVSEMADIIRDDITHVRDRAMVVTPLKLGVRATELCNIKLSEIHIANAELQEHYPDMGTHPALEDRPNAVYIPHDREGNKRERPTVLPVDDELRRCLQKYLLMRPDTGSEYLFLSKKQALQMDRRNVNDVWVKYFQPPYGKTDRFRAVSSHYGRHFFTTWFKRQQEWPQGLVEYMRGDRQGGGDIQSTRGAIHRYVHTYFEDVESRYRKEIFKLRL